MRIVNVDDIDNKHVNVFPWPYIEHMKNQKDFYSCQPADQNGLMDFN